MQSRGRRRNPGASSGGVAPSIAGRLDVEPKRLRWRKRGMRQDRPMEGEEEVALKLMTQALGGPCEGGSESQQASSRLLAGSPSRLVEVEVAGAAGHPE
eukprot:6448598-Pyramimonas_sp.AAC.1